jgi:RimJ/RimL family protein N-acetyltransferase
MITDYECRPLALVSEIPEQAREWRNNEKVRRWCRQDGLITKAQHADWLEKIHTDPSIEMFGIVEAFKDAPSDIKPVGVCGLTSIDMKNSKAEFSLYIAPEHRGKGYGKLGLTLLLSHGFNGLGLGRIWGEVFDGNPAMVIFEELEFVREGLQRQTYWKGGKYIDTHIISILREEFNGDA